MKEKDFQSKFNRWLKYQNFNAVFELKFTKKKSLSFSLVKEHQILALLAVKHRKLIYKISDIDQTSRKPFDSFCLSGIDAYVVIMFYRRANKIFYLIDIDDFLKFKKTSKRKSLTEKDCKRIGITYKLN